MDIRIWNRSIPLFLLLALVLLLAIGANGAYLDGEILVKYKPGKSPQAPRGLAIAGARVEKSIEQIRTHRIKLPQGTSVEDAIKKLRQDPDVEYAGPNHVIHTCLLPNDEWFSLEGYYMQWGLYSDQYPDAGIDAAQAWDITTGTDIIIAFVDTGVYSYHEDLWAKIVPGQNTVTGADPNNIEDDNGHGTFTSGIAAAMSDNTIGIAGVSWGARIMPIKVMQADGSGSEADAAAGIIWAADHGAKIISMSIGGYDDVQAEKDAVAYAWSKGCVLVGASGNDGRGDPFYPAYYDQVLAVGASNEIGQRCSVDDWLTGGSNYGDYLDVVAPGNNIMSTWWDVEGGTYNAAPGTSAAAPFVSGVAALVWGQHPTLSNAEVVNQIKMTCKDVLPGGWDEYTGWGIVSAYHALVDTPITQKTIGDMNSMGSGTLIKIGRAVITSGSSQLSDRMYIEQEDRACGTMLPFTKVPAGYSEGDLVEVLGTVMTVNGERTIQGATLTRIGHRDPLKPLGVVNRWIGGGRLGLKSGVRNGMSLNNIGLLVKIWGKVVAGGWDYFYLDDGSMNSDGSGLRGLKVVCGNMTQPAPGTIVCVTGISSMEQPPRTTVKIPLIWVRRQSDISALPPH